MKTLFVFLLIMPLSVSASVENEALENRPGNNTSAVEAVEEAAEQAGKKSNFGGLGLGLSFSGIGLSLGVVQGLETITGDDLSDIVKTGLYSAGMITTVSACAVAWIAQTPKKSKK